MQLLQRCSAKPTTIVQKNVLSSKPGSAPHGEADMGNPEETKEVQLANQILAAIKSKNTNAAICAASELIRMHHAPTAASYRKQLSLMALPQSSSAPSSP